MNNYEKERSIRNDKYIQLLEQKLHDYNKSLILWKLKYQSIQNQYNNFENKYKDKLIISNELTQLQKPKFLLSLLQFVSYNKKEIETIKQNHIHLINKYKNLKFDSVIDNILFKDLHQNVIENDKFNDIIILKTSSSLTMFHYNYLKSELDYKISNLHSIVDKTKKLELRFFYYKLLINIYEQILIEIEYYNTIYKDKLIIFVEEKLNKLEYNIRNI